MAAVIETKNDPAAKYSSQVDEQIEQATSRIRVHDLTLGGLTLGAMVAIYAVAMIVLDKYLTLPEWVRQLSLAGLLALLATVGYFFVVRPLRKRINPLYAAARVEDTIEDAKNSVTGYVEAQENGNVHLAVKAAMSARAAKAVGEADVNHAIDHRNLLIAGGVLVAFVLILGVLFFLYRPTQFASLVGRAFVPFSSDPIATRTQLTLVKPEPLEPTITTGQTITVMVQVGGKVPTTTDPTRVRLLLRHNPADPNYEELPMVEGETTREWLVKVPEYLVQNGFWYKVAGGDAETQEYKVTVRSLPLFTDFEATYEYPKYTRKPSDKANDPNLHAYRGTKVTLIARTNRTVALGEAKFEAAALPPVAGKPIASKPDSLAFQFTLTEATRYRLYMTTTTGEKNLDPPPYVIALDSDQPPRVEITKPEEPEITAPANGQLAVDGTVGDDFGIDKVRLCMRADGRELAPLPYMGGKSFLRAKDKSWPTDLVYKDAADLTKLKYADGAKFEPKEGMVIEFWVEAIDNCAEAPEVKGWGEKPQNGQVGASPIRKLRLLPPTTDEDEKKKLDQEKQQRQNEDQQHNQKQQQKFDKEDRTPKQPQQNNQQEKKESDGQPASGDGKADPKDGKAGGSDSGKKDNPDSKDPQRSGMGGMGGTGNMPPPNGSEQNPPDKNPADPKGGDMTKPKGGDMGNTGSGMPDPKTMPDPKSSNTGSMGGGMPDPMKKPDGKPMGDMPTEGMKPNMGEGGNPNPAPPPRSEDDKRSDAERDRVKEELGKNKGEGGDAKPNSTPKPEERTDPGMSKPQPMNGGEQESQPKEGPKPEPKNPMGGSKGDKNGEAANTKPEGSLEKNNNPDEPKQQPDQKAATAEQRDGPLGGSAGQNKESPPPMKETSPSNAPDPKNQTPKKDPASGAAGKPASDKPEDSRSGPEDKRHDPAGNAGKGKENPEPSRGMDKNPQPKGAPPESAKPQDEGSAAEAKPDKATPPGERKGAPQKDPMGKQGDSDPKEPPKDPMNAPGSGGSSNEAGTTKPANPMGGMGIGAGKEKNVEKGIDKDDPKNQPQDAPAELRKKDEKNGGAGDRKLTEKERQQLDKLRKDLDDAAKDLNDPDPTKQQAARDKLDKAIGKEKREELEQLQSDLKSPNKDRRDAAEKKVEDMKKKAEEAAKKETDKKGNEPSTEEIADLMKKAKDLNSKDENARRAAEDALDEQIGKEAREKLQEEMKKQPPMDQKQAEDLAKKLSAMAQSEDLRKRMEEERRREVQRDMDARKPKEDPTDPRNKAKTAELQLEEFEKHRDDRGLRDRLGWTDDKWDAFLKDQAKRVEQLQKEAAAFEDEMRKNPPPTPGASVPTDTGEGKLSHRPDAASSNGTSSGATFAPPGFDDAKKRFLEAAKKLDQKK